MQIMVKVAGLETVVVFMKPEESQQRSQGTGWKQGVQTAEELPGWGVTPALTDRSALTLGQTWRLALGVWWEHGI